MNVSKKSTYFFAAVFAGAILSAGGGINAHAGTSIKNAADCKFEGGTMTQVKGSDYCLVSIRPTEYAATEYDGNQLGVTDCPGDKLNEGVFCMYPVTIRPAIAQSAPTTSKTIVDKLEGIDGETVKSVTDDVKKKKKSLLGH